MALQTLLWAMTSFGPIAQPQRQPVIAYAFDAALQITVRSRIRSSRMPTTLCDATS